MSNSPNPYTSKDFADNWDRIQKTEDEYKNNVLLPMLFERAKISELNVKRVCELGCGNGNFANLLLGTNIESLYAIDISKFNLANALKNNNKDSRLKTLEFNLSQNFRENKRLFFESDFDLVVSNMVVNELTELDNFFGLASSILSKKGRVIISALSQEYSEFLDYPKVFNFEVENLGISIQNYCWSEEDLRSIAQQYDLNFSDRIDLQIGDKFISNNPKFHSLKNTPLVSIYTWTK